MDEQPSLEVRAKDMGWAPREEWKGDAEKWVDAETFVKRGEEILPILRSNNKRLESQLAEERAARARLEAQARETQEAIEALKEHQVETTKRAVEQAKARLKAELIAAKKEGDVEREVEVAEQMRNLESENAGIPATKKAAAASAPTPTPAADPIFQQWAAENDWFTKDPIRQSVAVTVGNMLRQDPAFAHVTGRAFLDEVAKRTAAQFRGAPDKSPPKVEGGGAAPSGGSSGSGRRTYADLPAEAKAVCEKQASKLVGEGRAFKTKEQWQAAYVRDYYMGEEA